MTTWTAALLLFTVGANPDVEVIAHRGESADAPENTHAAFDLAWQRGLPAIELDVHLTQDDRLAVIHDGDLKRTAGVELQIKNSNWADLVSYDVGRWKNAKFSGEKIPLLEEVLAKIPDGRRCYIEVKVGPEAVPALVNAVEASGKKPEQLPIISFKAATIAEVKRRLPKHPAYWISGFKQDDATKQWEPTVEQLIEKAREINADGLDVSFKGPIDETFVRQVREAKLELYVWTVDDAAVARRLVALGVAGITTNKGAWLRERLKADGSTK